VVALYSQGLNVDEPLAMLRSGTTSYYEADGLGSLTSLSNTSGALANASTYNSFEYKDTGRRRELSMPVSSSVVFRWTVVGTVFVVFVASVTLMVFAIPPGLSRFFGGPLVAVGIFTLVAHRRFGQQIFRWTRSSSRIVGNFWESIGQQGAQSFYLGIGLALTLAGFFLLIKAWRN
jgi:hypothetical protein